MKTSHYTLLLFLRMLARQPIPTELVTGPAQPLPERLASKCPCCGEARWIHFERDGNLRRLLFAYCYHCFASDRFIPHEAGSDDDEPDKIG